MTLSTPSVAQVGSTVPLRSNTVSERELKKYFHQAKIAISNSKSFASDLKPFFDPVINELKIGVEVGSSSDSKLHIERIAENKLKLLIPTNQVKDLSTAKKTLFKCMFYALNKEQDQQLISQRFTQLYPSIVFPSDIEIEDLYVEELAVEVLESASISEYQARQNMEDGARLAREESSKTESTLKKTDVNSQIFKKLARFYPSNPREAWKGYSGELTAALDRGQEDTSRIIVDILNAFYLLTARTTPQLSEESISDYYKRVCDTVLDDLCVSLLGYFNLAKRGLDTQRSVVLGAVSHIKTDESKLFRQMQGNASWDKFSSKFSRAEISYQKFQDMEREFLENSSSGKTLRISHASNMAASGVGLLALTHDGSSPSSGVRLLGFAGDSSGQSSSPAQQKLIEVSTEFLGLNDTYKIGTPLIDKLKSSLTPDSLKDRTSLMGAAPNELFGNFDIAFKREELKTSNPEDLSVSLQGGINEMEEYLKYLHSISSGNGSLQSTLKKVCGEISPPIFLISQTLYAYLEGYLRTKELDEAKKIEEAYIGSLGKLESESIDFKHIGQLVHALRVDAKSHVKGKKTTEDKSDAQGIAQIRAKERGELITGVNKAHTNNAAAKRKQPIPSACPSRRSTDKKDIAVTFDGFIKRLTNPFFMDEETKVILGNHVDEAKLEIIYLFSGMIPLTYVDSGRPIKVCKEGVGYEELSRDKLIQNFERATTILMSEVHADRVARVMPELVVGVGEDKKSFAKECFAFLTDFKEFVNLNKNWGVEVLPEKLSKLIDIYSLSMEKAEESRANSISRELSDTIASFREDTKVTSSRGDRVTVLEKRLDLQMEIISGMWEVIVLNGIKGPKVDRVSELLESFSKH